MNDDQMDELLIQGARDYNQPGAVPRDAMWGAIVRERAARRGAAARAGGATRRAAVWVWPSVGVAAAALLFLGIGIGRRLERQPSVQTAAVTPVVAKPSVDSSKPAEDSVVKALHEETKRTDATVRQLAQTDDRSNRRAVDPSIPPTAESPSPRIAASPSRDDSRQLAYRLVVLRHLAGSEALITAFRTSAKRGEMDTQIAQWSRELLGTTRMLEASAAADDPVMKRLLEDLDLVIAQIAQYTARGTYNAEELDLIEQSINQRGVMTKLRSTTASSTTHM